MLVTRTAVRLTVFRAFIRWFSYPADEPHPNSQSQSTSVQKQRSISSLNPTKQAAENGGLTSLQNSGFRDNQRTTIKRPRLSGKPPPGLV